MTGREQNRARGKAKNTGSCSEGLHPRLREPASTSGKVMGERSPGVPVNGLAEVALNVLIELLAQARRVADFALDTVLVGYLVRVRTVGWGSRRSSGRGCEDDSRSR